MNEPQLSEIAKTTLTERYLLRNEHGSIIETPQGLFWRVAHAVAGAEKVGQQTIWANRFYKVMAEKDFLPNTPTLMNAGRENGQLSACFVLPIEDSIQGIYKTLGDAAEVHRTGGGTGFSFSSLRPEGAMVSNKSGVSTGPLAFCQLYDKSTDVVKQGASRRGANMMTFDVHHPDIEKFIDMKMTSGVMTNFNVSVCITNEFMEALEKDEAFELRFEGRSYGYRSARAIWDKIAANAHKSAEPGIIFIDRVNDRSPYEERIVATNPCGEQPLPPYGACNLGSINLANFVVEYGLPATGDSYKDFDWDRLMQVVDITVRFLDNVIDVNCWPLPEIEAHAQKYRNIGLGIMGWADALLKLGIPYNSEEAVQLAEQVGLFINNQAHNSSIHLGEEKGFPSGAPFKTFFKYSTGMRRNATLTTIAPTGTISMIAGPVSSGCEPVFAYIMKRLQMGMELIDYHYLYKQAQDEGWYDPEVFVESHQVSTEYHIRMQAAFQKHNDSAISKTANLPNECSVEDVKTSYLLAWETGCKGITVYRDGSRAGVLHKIEKEVEADACCEAPNIQKQDGCETCTNCYTSKCLIA